MSNDLPNRAGQRIPLPDEKINFLSISYARRVVRAVNAFLTLRKKNGQLLISDNNSLLDDFSTADTGGTVTVEGAPWQIVETGTNTIQVSAGKAIGVDTHPFQSSSVSANTFFNSVGTGVDIVLPSSTIIYVWARIWIDGGVYKAEVQTSNAVSYPPADWYNVPSIQGANVNSYTWLTGAGTPTLGYALIGMVDTSTSPLGITQYVFDTIHFPVTPSGAMVYLDVWIPGITYNLNNVVKNSAGASRIRYAISNGADGGDPINVYPTSDWVAL